MKIVAFAPIKLNNERLPNKNILPLGGKPLCSYLFNTLLQIRGIDGVYCFCSDEGIKDYLPNGVTFQKRDKRLDGCHTKTIDICKEFVNTIDADVYMLCHVTAPFIKKESIQTALNSVISGRYDSAFSAKQERTFAWYNNAPINYSLTDIPRTQDIEPVIIETSAFYIFEKNVLLQTVRRIGDTPYIQMVDQFEAIDIDYPEDFEMAKAVYEIHIKNQ